MVRTLNQYKYFHCIRHVERGMHTTTEISKRKDGAQCAPYSTNSR